MIERQIDSPIPIPPDLVVKKALNSRSAFSAEIPTPESVTVTSTRSVSSCCDRITRSRGRSVIDCIASMPFITRLMITCCSWTRSPRIMGRARFVQVGGTAVEPTPAGRRGIDDGGERLVHFMGDGGCQFAQRRHARYACELHLGIEEALLASPQLLFCPLAVSHVDDKDNSLVSFPLEKGSA